MIGPEFLPVSVSVTHSSYFIHFSSNGNFNVTIKICSEVKSIFEIKTFYPYAAEYKANYTSEVTKTEWN
jgi:hypothetical protein